MPFSQGTVDFLFENRLNDSKVWYQEHKEDYKAFVIQPFSELITNLEPTIHSIDGELMCNPKKISRLYRDTRFSRGLSIFRDDVWYSFANRRELGRPTPEFYFEISPRGFEYGCGFYMMSSATLEAVREKILSGDKLFKKALRAYEKQDVFELGGELYKRNRYPEQSERLCSWLNRKSLYLFARSNDFGMMFSEELAEKVAADYLSIAPIYEFFLSAV